MNEFVSPRYRSICQRSRISLDRSSKAGLCVIHFLKFIGPIEHPSDAHHELGRRVDIFDRSAGAAFEEGLLKLAGSVSAFQAFRSMAFFTGACRPRHRM